MENELIRLNKYLSENGICSRRQADEHILAGKVTINGKIADLGTKVNLGKDIVKFDGQTVRINKQYVYYVLYKPKGAITTSSDERERKTVLDFVPKKPRVYPVGRLDADSEGLIILTNDGDLTQRLTHPSFEHEKEYQVTVVGRRPKAEGRSTTADEVKTLFENGLLIDGKLMRADKVNNFSDAAFGLRPITFDITLHTGYNRQIRRMCDKIGLKVLSLKRVRVAGISLSQINLQPGEFKKVKAEDILPAFIRSGNKLDDCQDSYHRFDNFK